MLIGKVNKIYMDIQKTGYDVWKENIDKVLLYKYFQKQILLNTQNLQNQIKDLQNKCKESTIQDKQNYMGLLSSYFSSFINIEDKMNENLNNIELLEQLYKENNIDTSYASFLKWIRKENQMKLT